LIIKTGKTKSSRYELKHWYNLNNETR
jgi:hypothetical protein